MFQPGLVLPLDSIDKRRKNEDIQPFRWEGQPHQPYNPGVPTEQFEERRWVSSAGSQFGQNSEIQTAVEEEARAASSSKQNEKSGRAVSLENWRKISQIDADNSGRETGAKHHRTESEKWRSELSSGPVGSREEENAKARAKCRDKNCVNLWSSASAKTSRSAKSELEGVEAPPVSPAGRHVDPPENETRSEKRNNNAKSSSGERKRLKGNIWTKRVSRDIKEISHSPPSRNQFRTPSSVLLSSRKLSPTVLASSQKSNSTNNVNALNSKQANFYSKYDSTEGVTTAVVLGGFFVFVCLLVVYKTKLKPLWKERTARRQCSSPTAHRSDLNRNLALAHVHTAYTVKSLPGAMLYIPVENDYNTPVSLKRSLSDPEIYFPSAVRHSLIVAVNGIMPHEKLSTSSSSTCPGAETAALQIDINVIQPTPNISPSHSLRSIGAESKDLEADISGSGVNENFAGIPFLIVPPSPVRIRRVSFSDTSIDNEEQDETLSVTEFSPEINITLSGVSEVDETVTAVRRSRCTRQSSLQARGAPDSPTARRRRLMKSRQMTLPCNLSASMSYLQVPGQERGQARLSPVERRLRLPMGGIDGARSGQHNTRRRLTDQASIESYYSFASEGDGDIFASSENVRRGRVERQTSFCIPDTNISQYSEFNEDFNSSISDLFRRGRLENQGTFSEQGSIRSLSIDQEEITFERPGMREEEMAGDYLAVPAIREFSAAGDFPAELPYDDFEGYISSSCSISMSSDIESSHQITVPVFIEPAPPEIRFYGDLGQPQAGGFSEWREEIPRLVQQETLHTDSGLDTEEICPATPTGGRFSAGSLLSSPSNKRTAAATATESENLRLVLVRDIGIQCSAESPNLNLTRRSKSAEVGDHLERQQAASSASLCAGKFQSELLF